MGTGGPRSVPPEGRKPLAAQPTLGARAVIAQVSELMADNPEIAELDLNPVLATAAGCVAVDWRIRVE